MAIVTKKLTHIRYKHLLSNNRFSKFILAYVCMNHIEEFNKREIKILRKSEFFTCNVMDIVMDKIPRIFEELYITTDEEYFDTERKFPDDGILTDEMMDKCIQDFEDREAEKLFDIYDCY